MGGLSILGKKSNLINKVDRALPTERSDFGVNIFGKIVGK